MVLTGLTKALDLVGVDGLAAGGDQVFIIPYTGTMEVATGLMISTEEMLATRIGLCIQTIISTSTEGELKRGMDLEIPVVEILAIVHSMEDPG